jgi:RimJ/RimL family protein N-acetyltransferase
MCKKLCKPTKIYTKTGEEIEVRSPQKKDLRKLLRFINRLVGENAQILVNKKVTLKEERKWLDNVLKKIKEGKKHHLLAFYKGELVGGGGVNLERYREAHVGEVGVSLDRKYRRLGIGSQLLRIMIDIANKDNRIRLLYSDVYSTNKASLELKKKAGAKVVAVLPKYVNYKGRLVDKYFLYYPIKEGKNV